VASRKKRGYTEYFGSGQVEGNIGASRRKTYCSTYIGLGTTRNEALRTALEGEKGKNNTKWVLELVSYHLSQQLSKPSFFPFMHHHKCIHPY
jgi:hypothetical protein